MMHEKTLRCKRWSHGWLLPVTLMGGLEYDPGSSHLPPIICNQTNPSIPWHWWHETTNGRDTLLSVCLSIFKKWYYTSKTQRQVNHLRVTNTKSCKGNLGLSEKRSSTECFQNSFLCHVTLEAPEAALRVWWDKTWKWNKKKQEEAKSSLICT